MTSTCFIFCPLEIFKLPELVGIETALKDVLWDESCAAETSYEEVPITPIGGSDDSESQQILTGRRGYRRADGRAQIARYTRAIFRSTKTKLPRTRNGFDAFLLFIYGATFTRGQYWYENPGPYEFYKYLIEKVIGPARGKRIDREVFASLFYKTGSARAAYWCFDENVAAKLDLSCHMMKEAIEKQSDFRKF